MKKRRGPSAKQRSEQAIARASKSIADAGWKVSGPTENGRFVATKLVPEREDDSVTRLFESDYIIEGLAALVARREREESR